MSKILSKNGHNTNNDTFLAIEVVIPFNFFWFVKSEVRRIAVSCDQMLFPFFAGLEFQSTSLNQTLILKSHITLDILTTVKLFPVVY